MHFGSDVGANLDSVRPKMDVNLKSSENQKYLETPTNFNKFEVRLGPRCVQNRTQNVPKNDVPNEVHLETDFGPI